MLTKGDFRAKALKICLRDAGLTESVTKQLDHILQEQFKPENYRELGGVAYFRNNWLELDLVHPPQIKEVEDSLVKFSQGDYSGLDSLSLFVNDAVDFHQKYHGEVILFNALRHYINAVYNKSKEDPNNLSLTEKERRNAIEIYKRLMKSYTVVPLDEHIDKPGFLGSFHVHPSGSKPSPADINSSSEDDLPALVFSALPTYPKTGISIYLLHLGNEELLYQGPLH
ncbi:MAG: hypothetical protein AABY40_00455 [Nanoarchaeota archaeon]